MKLGVFILLLFIYPPIALVMLLIGIAAKVFK